MLITINYPYNSNLQQGRLYSNIQENLVKEYNNNNGMQEFKNINYTLPQFYVDELKSHSVAMFNIDPVDSNSVSPFAGYANIRISKLQVFLEGATTANDTLKVFITRYQRETIYKNDGRKFSFEHEKPIDKAFEYNYKDKTIPPNVDGSWYSNNGEGVDLAVYGPFAKWKISVKDNNNISLENLTRVDMIFSGKMQVFPHSYLKSNSITIEDGDYLNNHDSTLINDTVNEFHALNHTLS